MSGWLAGGLLGWVPFLYPLDLPPGGRLWMMFPLVLCIAAVYRATRSRSTAGMLWPTLLTFVNILLGMAAIAVGFFLVHKVALLWF